MPQKGSMKVRGRDREIGSKFELKPEADVWGCLE
jgi:hypothetical protein